MALEQLSVAEKAPLWQAPIAHDSSPPAARGRRNQSLWSPPAAKMYCANTVHFLVGERTRERAVFLALSAT
jgi:hypothetical protein